MSIWFPRKAIEEQLTSSAIDVGKTAYPHVKECISVPISNDAQKEFKTDYRHKSAGRTVTIKIEKTRCYQECGGTETHMHCW